MNLDRQIEARHRELELSYKDYLRMQKNLEHNKIDKYYILEQIGEGAFAEVYKGIDDENKKQVAIKVLNIRNIQSEKNLRVKKIRKRLVHEQSKIMMKFNSPHILKCYECFENRDLKIMVIEFCNQGSLQDKIDKMKKIPETEAISILKQLINGIGQCHKQKIIHRDLKADNILIHNGECKIADFGFSKALQITNQNDLTMNTVLGTMTTMAPEVMKRQPYGLKADIWSIGVIFFQMIFGECPFKSDNSHEMVAQIMSTQLLNNEQYKGVKPSNKVRKFLQQVLVVDIKNRLGWKQLIEHEVFRVQNQNLSNNFVRMVQMRAADQQLLTIQRQFLQDSSDKKSLNSNSYKDSELVPENQPYPQFSQLKQYQPQPFNNVQTIVEQNDQKSGKKQDKLSKPEQKKQDIKPERKKQDIKPERKKQDIKPERKKQDMKAELKEHDVKEVTNSKFRKVNPSELNQVRNLVNKEEDQIYKWAKKIHVECLKTECIFNNIIKVIQNYQLLDMKNREIIEMMYLICTRCRNNISPINHEYEKRKNNQIIKNLHETISKLYKQVTAKWQYYSKMLTKKQNQKSAIVFDFFSKIVASKQRKIKDRFLIGIQSMIQFRPQDAGIKKQIQKEKSKVRQDDLLDYDKEQQIEFTYDCITENIKNIKFSQKAKEIRNFMKHYKDVCHIEAEDLKDRPFKEHLKLLLM